MYRAQPRIARQAGPRGSTMRRRVLVAALVLGVASPALADPRDPDLGWGLRDEESLAEEIDDPTLNTILLAASDSDGPPPTKETTGSSEQDLDAIGEAMANPLSYLWLMFTQNDTIWNEGDILDDLDKDAKAQNTFLINPVLSVQLTEQWKTIIRPVIPFNSFNTVDNVTFSVGNTEDPFGVDRERETGLGDIVLWTAFSKQYTPPLVWGFGPTVMMNTATDDQLGSGKWSAGPMGLGMWITDQWILGAVAQHWWSFAGEDGLSVDTSLGRVRVDRPDVNLTDIQPVIRYRLSPKTNIGLAPNWRYNWETDELSLPIGIGADTLVKIGPLPVKIGLEGYYYVQRDDNFGPAWQLRFLFVPVIPAPEWSRKPLFDWQGPPIETKEKTG